MKGKRPLKQATIINLSTIRSILSRAYKSITGKSNFTNSQTYWEDRYRKGGNSGTGSYNNLAEFKAEVINRFVSENDIKSVIELGSGDGNQLKYFNFKSYTGFDVSQSAISRCRKLYETDRSKRFELLGSYNGEKADLTLSLDVIYHLIEDEIFHDHMSILFSASEKFVIIYSSNADDHENNNVAVHVRHRKFTNWIQENASVFTLIHFVPNKYPYNKDGNSTSYADFYIFQKKD